MPIPDAQAYRDGPLVGPDGLGDAKGPARPVYVPSRGVWCGPDGWRCACGSEWRWHPGDALPWAWMSEHRRCEQCRTQSK